MQTVFGAILREVLVGQLDRPLQLSDGVRGAAYRRDPVSKLLDVADRGGQAHQPNMIRKVDHHLFPDRATECVLQKMHLVEHNKPKI